MNKKPRNTSGQFITKGQSLRKVRTFRLDNETFLKISSLSQDLDISSGELLTRLFSSDFNQIKKQSLSKLPYGRQSTIYKNCSKVLDSFLSQLFSNS